MDILGSGLSFRRQNSRVHLRRIENEAWTSVLFGQSVEWQQSRFVVRSLDFTYVWLCVCYTGRSPNRVPTRIDAHPEIPIPSDAFGAG